jgi:hypothetical protein
MEKYCQNCHKSNLAEAQFCRFCAAPLAAAPPVEPTPPIYANPQWNQPVTGAQPPQNLAPAQAGASGRAIASLGLSIGGLLLCCLLASVPGAILGWMEVNAIKEGRSSPAGMTMAQIGLWGGIVVTVLTLLAYGFYILAALSGGGGYYYY